MYVVRDARGCPCAHARTRAAAHRATRHANRVGGSVDLNRAVGDDAKLREITGYVEKYMELLGASSMQRPRIELRSNLGSRWLGQDEWSSKEPETTTMRIQRRVLGDARTLERIVAHETVHHVDSVLHGTEGVKLMRLGLYDGHGKSFLDLAEKINAVMGPCFVTVQSDKEYVEDAVCKTYLVMIVPLPDGKYGYAWTARLSKQQGDELMKQQVARGARGVYVTEPRWTSGAKIKRYGAVSVPKSEEDQARLRVLYESVAQKLQARLAG